MGGDGTPRFDFGALLRTPSRPANAPPEPPPREPVPEPAAPTPGDVAALAGERESEGIEGEFEPLPRAGDAYKAHSRYTNKPELMLGLITGTAPLEVFAYSDLRRARLLPPRTPGGGPALWLKFVEVEITEVWIEGRNLMTLIDFLQQHRVRWLRECPQGKEPRDPDVAVITRIVLKAVEGER